MIVEALKFPFKEQDWIRKMLAGSAIAFASLLIIPAPLLMGYILRVMSQDSMPGFNNLIQMYIDGLKAFAVIALYMLPGIALMAVFDGALAILGFLVFLVGWWGFESGMYHLANNGFREAFTVESLKTVFTLNYFAGIVLSVLVPLAVLFAYTVSLLLVVTVLLFPTVLFYESVVRYRIIKNAIERE